jgi:hypothetical protein
MKFKIINEGIFKNNDIKWFDKMGIFPIDENRLAEIRLSTSGTADHYTKYQVEIINKFNGRISIHDFDFRNYLDKDDRADSRKDYKGGFHIWDSDNINWYIAIPTEKNLKKLTTAIMEYIEMYK